LNRLAFHTGDDAAKDAGAVAPLLRLADSKSEETPESTRAAATYALARLTSRGVPLTGRARGDKPI